jgi:hypothetical protein
LIGVITFTLIFPFGGFRALFGFLNSYNSGMLIKYVRSAIVMATVLMSGISVMGQSTHQSHCLSYEPAVVTLSGTLVRKTFPGPPNYESVKKGDRPETSWFVDLPESVCVNEDRVDPDLNPKQSGILEIQLVLQPEQYQQRKEMIGRKVVATGTLFGEHTGHHHTPVLLTVRTLEEAPK